MAFGTVSQKVRDMSDEEILKGIGASGYKKATKNELLKNIRRSDARTSEAKDDYGNGVSVKGILVNVSGYHFLERRRIERERGKKWSDSEVVEPTNSVGPLDTSDFFHAKSDGAATGTRAGFTYDVIDKNGVVKGIVSIAWENPWDHNCSSFVYCVKISKSKDQLTECLDYCADNDDSTIDGDVTIKLTKGQIKRFITALVLDDDETTAYLLVAIKTDDMVREVWGDL